MHLAILSIETLHDTSLPYLHGTAFCCLIYLSQINAFCKHKNDRLKLQHCLLPSIFLLNENLKTIGHVDYYLNFC